jgi:signal peptidase I
MAGLGYVAPGGSFAMQGLIYALFVLIYLLFLLLSLVRTWQRSRRDWGSQWWSRWYAIILWFLVGILSSVESTAAMHRSYKPYYVASVSMEPTMHKDEKIVADMEWRTPQIGHIILMRGPDGIVRIYRVAAIGPQSFAMRNGVPIVDGHPAIEKSAGDMAVSDSGLGTRRGHLFHEQFPGEAGSHRILMLDGEGGVRDVPSISLPRGAIYLLGDDRDVAADSRVQPEWDGVGIAPASAIIGRPLYITWSRDRSRIGMRIDH